MLASPVLALPAALELALRCVRRGARRRVVRRPMFALPAFAFCALVSCVVLLFAFCANTQRSAKTSAAVVKVTKRRTTRNLALLFLLTDGYPPTVDICARQNFTERASENVCDDLPGLRRAFGASESAFGSAEGERVELARRVAA